MFAKPLMNFCVLVCVRVGEVTAEELRQRLDGAKERVSSQPRSESRPQNSEAGQEGSSGELLSTGAGLCLKFGLQLCAVLAKHSLPHSLFIIIDYGTEQQ